MRAFSLIVVAVSLAACSTLIAPLALDPGSDITAFSHDELDAVLEQYVDSEGRVDYAGLRREPERLERYYAQVAASSPDRDPGRFPDAASRLAYWINAYNAAVLVSVVRLDGIRSVRDVKAPWYLGLLPEGTGFFYYRKHRFGGETICLYDVENSIVRPRFADPRIHFALNCASIGCPKLPARAFRPEDLDRRLDEEARRFFAEPRNLSIDEANGTVRLSMILDWYAEDFLDWLEREGEADGGLVAYAARYAPAAVADRLRGAAREYRVEFVPYDWGLNDSAAPTGQ